MTIRRRIGVLSAVAGLLATLAIAGAPTTAQAADHNCDGRVNLGNFHFLGDRWIYTVHIKDAQEIGAPTFATRRVQSSP